MISLYRIDMNKTYVYSSMNGIEHVDTINNTK